jgi:hypothetical protein
MSEQLGDPLLNELACCRCLRFERVWHPMSTVVE